MQKDNAISRSIGKYVPFVFISCMASVQLNDISVISMILLEDKHVFIYHIYQQNLCFTKHFLSERYVIVKFSTKIQDWQPRVNAYEISS